MLKGKIEFRLDSEQRVCGQGDVVIIPGGTEHGSDRDRFLRASARRLPTRRQTQLHKRTLNSSLRLLTRKWLACRVRVAPACNPAHTSFESFSQSRLILSRGSNPVWWRRSPMSLAQRRTISRAASSRAALRQTTIGSCTRKNGPPAKGTGRIATCFRSFGFKLQGRCSDFTSWRARIRYTQTLALPAHE
jgi:hypothetical protein